MIHIHNFITRKPGLSEEQFSRYWKETHAPLVKRIPLVRRYLQSHRIPFPTSNSSYDGDSEVWLDDLDAMNLLRKSPDYLNGALKDDENFMDMPRSDLLTTEDHIIVDGPQTPGMVKGIWRFRRKPGMSLADFRRYWIDVHGSLGAKIPGLRRYVQSHTVDAAYQFAQPRWDGVAQLWFDNAAAFAAALETPQWRDGLAPDGPKFIELESMTHFIADQYQVL